METRLAVFATVLGIALGLPELAYASPFDTMPADYGSLVNSKLQQEGSHLQLRLKGCTAGTPLECRFVSSHITVVVTGRKKPPRIDRVTIATDLLHDNPATPPDVALADAFVTLAATMTIFEPTVQAQQREALTTSLAESVLSD